MEDDNASIEITGGDIAYTNSPDDTTLYQNVRGDIVSDDIVSGTIYSGSSANTRIGVSGRSITDWGSIGTFPATSGTVVVDDRGIKYINSKKYINTNLNLIKKELDGYVEYEVPEGQFIDDDILIINDYLSDKSKRNSINNKIIKYLLDVLDQENITAIETINYVKHSSFLFRVSKVIKNINYPENVKLEPNVEIYNSYNWWSDDTDEINIIIASLVFEETLAQVKLDNIAEF